MQIKQEQILIYENFSINDLLFLLLEAISSFDFFKIAERAWKLKRYWTFVSTGWTN